MNCRRSAGSPLTIAKSSGANNTVIVLNENEVAKLFLGDTRSDIGSEAEKMKFANTINNLVAKFIRLDFHEDFQAEMLVRLIFTQ